MKSSIKIFYILFITTTSSFTHALKCKYYEKPYLNEKEFIYSESTLSECPTHLMKRPKKKEEKIGVLLLVWRLKDIYIKEDKKKCSYTRYDQTIKGSTEMHLSQTLSCKL